MRAKTMFGSPRGDGGGDAVAFAKGKEELLDETHGGKNEDATGDAGEDAAARIDDAERRGDEDDDEALEGTAQRYQKWVRKGARLTSGKSPVVGEVLPEFRDGEVLGIFVAAVDAPDRLRPAGDPLGAVEPTVVFIEDVAVRVKVDLLPW